jgi:hypothetical protein
MSTMDRMVLKVEQDEGCHVTATGLSVIIIEIVNEVLQLLS